MVDFFEGMYKYMIENKKVKSVFGTRIYPLLAKQNSEVPFVVYTPITCNYDENLQQESGFVRQVVQFTIHDTSFAKVRKTSRIIRNIFKDFNGNMGGIKIDAVHSLNDMNIGTDDLSKEYMWVIELEFQFMEE